MSCSDTVGPTFRSGVPRITHDDLADSNTPDLKVGPTRTLL
jgi:hypothetical protein